MFFVTEMLKLLVQCHVYYIIRLSIRIVGMGSNAQHIQYKTFILINNYALVIIIKVRSAGMHSIF